MTQHSLASNETAPVIPFPCCSPASLFRALQDEPTVTVATTQDFQMHRNNKNADAEEKKDDNSQTSSPPSDTNHPKKKKGILARLAPSLSTATAPTTHRPILIIPGFMSSGLEIQKSTLRPDWQGKRLWLNLGSLGLSSFYFGSAQAPKITTTVTTRDHQKNPQVDPKQLQYKSHWLEHMRLDAYQEKPGIQIRPIPGLDGVDYLTPGMFTSHVSYVFGPVINALVNSGGYVKDKNLKAAPYDWRLSPAQLERRDHYFSNLIQQVEELYQTNHHIPICIVGHSLGTKCAHYFLNFAQQRKGRAWIDQHIYAYVPVGAPHLGAPKALRSVVVGDKMGLDGFLNDEEALVLGRSLESGPWLFPRQLPPGVPASAHIMPHGVLDIQFVVHGNETGVAGGALNTHDLVHNRTTATKPNRYQLMVRYSPGNHSNNDDDDKVNGDNTQTAQTPFTRVRGGGNGTMVQFSDRISFATHPRAKAARHGKLQFFLQEPGIAAAKEEKTSTPWWCCNPICCLLKWITCCCIVDYALRLVHWITCSVVVRGVTLGADAFTGGAGGSANLALSNVIPIPSTLCSKSSTTITKEVKLFHKDDFFDPYNRFLCFLWPKTPRTTTLTIQMKWTPFVNNNSSSSPRNDNSTAALPIICNPHPKQKTNLKIVPKGKAFRKRSILNTQHYLECSGHDLLQKEGLENTTLDMVKRVYEQDVAMGPRTTSSTDAPPVQRVHAIYGINLPTEVGGIYKRKTATCLSPHKLESLCTYHGKLFAMCNYVAYLTLSLFSNPKPQTDWIRLRIARKHHYSLHIPFKMVSYTRLRKPNKQSMMRVVKCRVTARCHFGRCNTARPGRTRDRKRFPSWNWTRRNIEKF